MAELIPIIDADDPRIAAYRNIRERDLVGRKGRFIAEGEVVLRLLLASRNHRAASLLIDEKRVAALEGMLANTGDTPVYVASQAVLDAIAGFHLHRGILALGETARPLSPDALLDSLPPRALVLCLFGVGNHDNMGGIFRNAAAFGADAVLLNSDCCDPHYRKAIRVSVGATLITPFARFEREDDAVKTLQAHGFEALALSPGGERTLAQTIRPERCAILLGSEGPGLAPEVMARTRTVRIAMAEGFDSLNVATTSGIVLHHLAMQGAHRP